MNRQTIGRGHKHPTGGVIFPANVLPGVGIGGFNNYSTMTTPQKATAFITNRGSSGDAPALSADQTTGNSNVEAMVYHSVAQALDSGSCGIGYAEANLLADTVDGVGTHHPCMRDSGGVDLVYTGAGAHLLDPLNTNVQNRLKSNILSWMQTNAPNCKAIFFDNVEMDYRNFTGNSTFTAALYPDLASWQSAYREMVRVVVAHMRANGYYCIGNDRGRTHTAIGTQDVDGTEATAWLNYLVNTDGSQIFNGHFYEYWVYRNDLSPTRIRRIGTANSYDHWTELQGMMRAVQAKGCDFYGQAWGKVTDADSAQAATYNRVSFLIDWNGGYGCSMLFYPNPFGNDYANYNDGNLGFPLAAKFEVSTTNSNTASPGSNIFRRNFDGGFVLINPTYGDVVFTAGDYIGTLANGSARIHFGP